jgi:N-acetyl-D-muramate 6-phosphate phosphatase
MNPLNLRGTNMNNRKISGVLFDLDGTLVDTVPDLARALNSLLARHQQPTLPVARIREVVTFGCAGLIPLGFNISTDHLRYPQLARDFLALYENDISQESRPFEGITTVLDALNHAKIPWGIVTNKAEHLARKVVTELGLMPDCACLIGGDTTPFSKPEPEPLYAACRLLERSPEDCVFIGDSPLDIEAARRANMPSIAALYGYLPANSSPTESWGAKHSVMNPLELLGLLSLSTH